MLSYLCKLVYLLERISSAEPDDVGSESVPASRQVGTDSTVCRGAPQIIAALKRKYSYSSWHSCRMRHYVSIRSWRALRSYTELRSRLRAASLFWIIGGRGCRSLMKVMAIKDSVWRRGGWKQDRADGVGRWRRARPDRGT